MPPPPDPAVDDDAPTSSRRLRWLVRSALILLCVLAVTGWLALRGLAAQRALESARTDLAQARSALAEQRVDEALAATTSAARSTARARALTDDPVWRVGAAVPYAGATLSTVRDITATADDLATSVLPPALDAARALEPGKLRRADGTVDLTRLDTATPHVRASVRALRAVRGRLTDPAAAVVGPVAAARDQLVTEVRELDALLRAADRALALAPPLLGADRPRRYFVLVQQVAESRGTGGLPGGFAVVEADRGRLRLTQQGSNAELTGGTVEVPAGVPEDYVRLYEPNGAFALWQNVNLSADLPTVAKVVAARWRSQGGAPLDGVVALDAKALASLLSGSEPLRIGDEAVPPSGLEQYLAVEQYRRFPTEAGRQARKDALSDVAAAAAQRLTSGGGDTETLLRGLVTAVRSGHLRMTSQDPALQPGLRAAGVDGALPSTRSPVAYPVVYNASGGKLDHFLERRVSYTAGPCTGDRRMSTVRVTLTNRAPAEGLPPYVLIRDVGGRRELSTTSSLVLQIYTTAGSGLRRATLDGKGLSTLPQGDDAYVEVAEEAGLRLWSVFLDLPREKPRTLVLELDEPTLAGPAVVPEQPLSRPPSKQVEVPDCS